jgi:hypothetical protein
MIFFKLPNNILYKIYEYDNTYHLYYTNIVLPELYKLSHKKKFKRFILSYLYEKIITKEFHILYYDINIIIKYIKTSLIKIYGYDKIYKLLTFYKKQRLLLNFNSNNKSKIIININYYNTLNNIIFNLIDFNKINLLVLDIYNNNKNDYTDSKYLFNRYLYFL